MQKHIQHNKDERRHFFRKIYLSLYWKGCVWEGVGDWTELQHIDPHSSGHNSISFPFSWAAQPGAWGPSLSGTYFSFQHLHSNSSELPLLNRGSWGPPLLGAGSLYSILSPTDSNFLCTESYYCFTPTQYLPITGQRNMQLPPSLEWYVGSSSSGNNCHAVHGSPSSGASVCDCTVGF